MSRSRREVPCENLLNVTADDDIRPPPRPLPPSQSPRRAHRPRVVQEVPVGDLIGIGGNDVDCIPPTPPIPSPRRAHRPRVQEVPVGNLIDICRNYDDYIPPPPPTTSPRPANRPRRVQEVPVGNLIDICENYDDYIPPPPPTSRRTHRPRGVQDVQFENLIDFGGNYDDCIPPPPPMPAPAKPAEHRTVMRYKPVPGKPGRMQVMFSQKYYEEIETTYPNQPLTLPEMYNMYEYPKGQDNAMGPWLRDPLVLDRRARGVSVLPGERATAFENLCGTDPNTPFGPESGWMSDEWKEIESRSCPVRNTEQRDIWQQMIARTERQQQKHKNVKAQQWQCPRK